MIKIKKDPQGFITTFNQENGVSIRSDIIDFNGNHIEPFMAEYPELLDICITQYCSKGDCTYCYMNSNNFEEYKSKYISIENFKKILYMIPTFQVALGGGDPPTHPRFVEILKICKDFDVVPNYTTNGTYLTKEILEATKKYCGAVAISYHDINQYKSGIKSFIDQGIKTNIHYVVTKQRIKSFRKDFNILNLTGVNAVICLLHKPVGRGNILNQPTIEEAINFIKEAQTYFQFRNIKLGFDACFAPALVNNNINPITFDYCDGGRFSAFIDWNMMMYPCSFARNESYLNGLNLKTNNFEEIWNSQLFEEFRNNFKFRCKGCLKIQHCGGGCPYYTKIIACNNFEKYNTKGIKNEN